MAKQYHIATLAALEATNLGGGFVSGSGQGGKVSADYKTVARDDANFGNWATKGIITIGPTPAETAIQKVPDLSVSPPPGDISNIMAIIPATSGSGVGTSYFYFFPNEGNFRDNAWKIPNLAAGGTIGSSPYGTNADAIQDIGTVGGVTIYYDNNILDVVASGG